MSDDVLEVRRSSREHLRREVLSVAMAPGLGEAHPRGRGRRRGGS
jgi:hypothetical protein